MRNTEICQLMNRRVGMIKSSGENTNASSWKRVEFKPPFELGDKVSVLPAGRFWGNDNLRPIKIQKVTSKSFEIRIETGSKQPNKLSELVQVAWIAFASHHD